MLKINSIVFAAILTIASSYSLASVDKSDNCPFPLHFKVEGPDSTSRRYIDPIFPSDFTLEPLPNNSFDVIDNTQCKGAGRREIRLVVAGKNPSHYSDITFIVDVTGHGKVFKKAEFNGFSLKSITKSGDTYVMTYADE